MDKTFYIYGKSKDCEIKRLAIIKGSQNAIKKTNEFYNQGYSSVIMLKE
jgi:hypothetical protein